MWKFCGKAKRPKLCGKCTFPQNFHTRKSGEIKVFFVVKYSVIYTGSQKSHLFSELKKRYGYNKQYDQFDALPFACSAISITNPSSSRKENYPSHQYKQDVKENRRKAKIKQKQNNNRTIFFKTRKLPASSVE